MSASPEPLVIQTPEPDAPHARAPMAHIVLAQSLLRWYTHKLPRDAREARLEGWLADNGLEQHAGKLAFLAEDDTWASITTDDDPVTAAGQFLRKFAPAHSAPGAGGGDAFVTPSGGRAAAQQATLSAAAATATALPRAPAVGTPAPRVASSADELKSPPVPKDEADAADIVMGLIRSGTLTQAAADGSDLPWLKWGTKNVETVVNWWTSTWTGVSALYKAPAVIQNVRKRIGKLSFSARMTP